MYAFTFGLPLPLRKPYTDTIEETIPSIVSFHATASLLRSFSRSFPVICIETMGGKELGVNCKKILEKRSSNTLIMKTKILNLLD